MTYDTCCYYSDVAEVLIKDRLRAEPHALAERKIELRRIVETQVWREWRGLPVGPLHLTQLPSRELNALSETAVNDKPLLAEAAYLVRLERVGAWDKIAHSPDLEEQARARTRLRELFRALPDAALRDEVAEWHEWRSPDDEYGAAEVIAKEVLEERSGS